ncbi:MAG: regulatory iron-sulfur-containing complex subunit RicT [Sumerlaeia bacterium]
MPKLICVQFSEQDFPKRYDANGLDDIGRDAFVLAEREDSQDIGFVAGYEYVCEEQITRRREPFKRLLRAATDEEKEAFFVRKAAERKALELCKRKAVDLKLPMKVSTARINPADGRVIFQFTSDQRVDFRQLVRELTGELRTRVELWQIGVRDEARNVDGYGVCGLRTCCSQWLPDFRPISIRMAKEQDIFLPPGKLSGQCGRLLCCLSYEVDQYREMSKGLLSKGATVTVDGVKGVVIDRNVLLGRYVVSLESGSITTITADMATDVQVPDQMKKMARAFSTKETAPPVPAWQEEDRPAQALAAEAPAPAPPEARPAPAAKEKPPKSDRSRRGRRGKRGGEKAGGSTDDTPKAQAEAAPSMDKGGQEKSTPADKARRKEGRKRRRERIKAKRGDQASSDATPKADAKPAPGAKAAPGDGAGKKDKPSDARKGRRGRRKKKDGGAGEGAPPESSGGTEG